MLPGWTEEDVYRIAERAHSLYLEGRYPEAAVIFEGLVVVDPSNAYCREALAAVHFLMGDAQRALFQLDELLAREPRNAAARARRCEALLRLGRGEEARRDLEQLAGRIHPHAARLRLLLQAPGAAQLPGPLER